MTEYLAGGQAGDSYMFNSLEAKGKSSAASPASPEDDERRMFIGGMSWATTEVDLKDYFSKYGEVEDACIKKDHMGKPRGFGFILFKDAHSCDTVLMDAPHVLSGRTIDPKKARPQSKLPEGPPRKIYVRNCKHVREDQLRAYFGKYGVIANMDTPMYRNDDGSMTRREYCFIEFEMMESVDAACVKSFHTIGEYSVEVRQFVAKESGAASRGRGPMPIPSRGAPFSHMGGGPPGYGRGGPMTGPAPGQFHPYGATPGYGAPAGYGAAGYGYGAVGQQPAYGATPSSYYGNYYQNYSASAAAAAASGAYPGWSSGGTQHSAAASQSSGGHSTAGYGGHYL